MREKVVRLDVREDLRRGREPFSKILQAVAQLEREESLLLIAPFEPKPLFAVLERQGFSHRSKSISGEHWEVLFTRADARAATAPCVVEVDARGLEPPQPMVRILEALANLPVGAELRALTDRRPLHLYPQLEQRGFSTTSEERADGSFVTCIRRC